MSSSKTYNLLPGATRGIEISNRREIYKFYTLTSFIISNISVKLEPRFGGTQDRQVKIVIEVDGVDIANGVITYPGTASPEYYLCEGLSVTIPANSTLIIYATIVNAYDSWLFWYGGGITDNAVYNFGVAGTLTSHRIEIGCACNFTATIIDPLWIKDGGNSSYAYPINTTPIDWTGFEKNSSGYPTNWGVWKLDNQNDRYPWIIGYKKGKARNAQILVKGDEYFEPAMLSVYNDNHHFIQCGLVIYT